MTIKRPPRKIRTLLGIKQIDVKDLYRVSQFSTGEPYFGKSAANRFDDPSHVQSKRFGTCYFGLDLETAIAETVLHDEMPVDGAFYVAYSELERRFLIRFTGELLNLANLTGIALKRLLGDSSISTIPFPYINSKRWAKVIHNHSDQTVDGIYYMSRQLNDRPAIVVFERAKSKIAFDSCQELLQAPGIIEAVAALHIEF